MAFSELDRVNIRTYIGHADLYFGSDPRLERAITALQAITDGGSMPTADAENYVKVLLVKLQAIDAQIDALMDQNGAGAVDEIKVDSARETARLRSVGRMYCGRLARRFDTYPRADAFGLPDMSPDGGHHRRGPY
jgi:hypothetical protein